MGQTSLVAAGQILANKYLVEGVLGTGGMGVVVAAWHLGLEQRVAIKLLLRERLTHDSSAVERFQREARAAARIRSEYVCRVLDTGALDDGTPFLVMEYLEGHDLAEELVQRGRLPVNEAVFLIWQACDAVQKAHEAGIVHRDLKPANLFLMRRPDGARVLKVLDFGVSKSTDRAGAQHRTLTKTSALVGSPIYMSPEQLNSSKDVDERTDLWALGSILYELLTGRTPFHGESMPQLVNSVLNQEPESFQTLGITLPAGLEAVIMRALSKRREERFSSADELAHALAPFAPTSQISSSHTAMISPHSSPAEAALRRARGPAHRAWLLLPALAIAAAAALLSRRAGPPNPPTHEVSQAGLQAAADAGENAEARASGASNEARASEVSEAAATTGSAQLEAPASLPTQPAQDQAARAPSPLRTSVRTSAAPTRPADPKHPAKAESAEPSVYGVTNFGGRH